jgi:hypothetical protein
MHKHGKKIQTNWKNTKNKMNAKKVEKIFLKTKINKKRKKDIEKNEKKPLEKFPNFVTIFKQVLLVQTCLHIAL